VEVAFTPQHFVLDVRWQGVERLGRFLLPARRGLLGFNDRRRLGCVSAAACSVGFGAAGTSFATTSCAGSLLANLPLVSRATFSAGACSPLLMSFHASAMVVSIAFTDSMPPLVSRVA
jgi:hypothetical protein